jgi:segregation and condensation protein B
MGQLDSQVEALLFVSGKPVSLKQLTQVLNSDNPKVITAIKQLVKRYETGGLTIVESTDGWQISTKPEHAKLIEEMIGLQPNTLSPAALEVLSIIAYSQPISKDQIDDIRGVASDQTLRHLIGRELVESRKTKAGGPLTYHTTSEFLLAAGLRNVSELPKVEPDAK